MRLKLAMVFRLSVLGIGVPVLAEDGPEATGPKL